MVLDRKDTALVVIDPQNDVLSETGISWDLVRESLEENNTIENLAQLFKAANNRDSACSSLLTTSIPPTSCGNSRDARS